MLEHEIGQNQSEQVKAGFVYIGEPEIGSNPLESQIIDEFIRNFNNKNPPKTGSNRLVFWHPEYPNFGMTKSGRFMKKSTNNPNVMRQIRPNFNLTIGNCYVPLALL